MAVALVQYASAQFSSATFASPPTPGNLIVICGGVQDVYMVPDFAMAGTDVIGPIYNAHPMFGGKGQMFFRVAELGDGSTWGIGSASGNRSVIIAEFSGVDDAVGSVLTSAQSQSGTTLALTGTPAAPALVLAGFATRLHNSAPTFTPNGDSAQVNGLPDTGSHDIPILVWAESDGSEVTLGGTQGGSTVDGYWWGGALVAFEVSEPDPPPPPPDPEPGVVIDPTAVDPIPIGDDIIKWVITRGASAEITGGAQPGTCTLTVKNTQNTAGEDAYNPENGSSPLISYLHDGTAVWVGVNEDGKLAGEDPAGLFGGRFTDITPIPAPGATVAPTVEIVAEDALGWMGRVPVRFGYEAGRSHGELRTAILAAAAEERTDLAHEILTMPLSAAEGNALGLLEELNRANGTRHFAKPADASADWYTYVTRNRQHRLDATPDYTLSQEDDHVTASGGWRLSADTVTNQQKATSTPVVFTPSTFPVWAPETVPSVAADRPYEVWVDFDDYVSAPVVNSSYSGSTPTITLTALGTSARLTITVASGTCVFTHLSIDGALARRAPQESWVAGDVASQVLPRGVRAGSDITSEYTGTLSTARGIAEHVVWRYAQPQVRPTITVENWFPYMFQIDLYDLVSYSSPQLGVTDRLFEVVGLTHEGNMAAETGQHHVLTLVLQECRVQDAADFPWFYLDDPACVLDDGVSLLAY